MDNKSVLGLGALVGVVLILVAINVTLPFDGQTYNGLAMLIGIVLLVSCLGRLIWMVWLYVIYTAMLFCLVCAAYFVSVALQHQGTIGPYQSAWAVSKGWGDGNIGGAMGLAILFALMFLALAYGKGKVSH